MEFRVFIGGHRTAQDHLRQQLDANSELLEQNRILLPSDDKMEAAVWPAIKAVRKNTANEQTLPRLIAQLTDGRDYDKVLILRPSISGSPLRPSKDTTIYPRGSSTVSQLMRLIGQDSMRVFAAVRNPANFLPSCYSVAYLADPTLSFAAFSAMSDPFALRWSEYLHRLQGRDDGVPLNVWTYEDYPYIWRSVAQAFAGLPNKEELVAAPFEPEDPEISLRGISLMQQYLLKHPTENMSQRNQVARKFAERFPPIEGETMADIWTEDMVNTLTDSYEDDLYYIERMDNVRVFKRPVYA